MINAQNKHGITAIYIASYNGHSSVVFTLLANGADPNLSKENGWTPLMAASRNGHGDVVELLKTQVNINYQTSTGTTALHLSSQYGHENIVRQLLKRVSNQYLKDKSNETPLDKANQNHHYNISYLLQGGTMTAFGQSSPVESGYGSATVSPSLYYLI